jgi:putative methionine-R-sulfoxide reductase with GAF domain
MDTYPNLEKNPPQAPVIASVGAHRSGSAGAAAAPAMARETFRFPGEDGGKSLGEMAQRDLDATLQLLAERAQYISGASGAAIALRDGENMVCCASAGDSAPALGAHLQIDSGLSAESVRTRKILHCEDADTDPRVNRESCKALGIASVVVLPLVRGEEVYGVFELLAGRPRAFEERDFTALQRLSEMIQTAVEHADAARRAEKEFGPKTTATVPTVKIDAAGSTPVPQPVASVVATPSEKQGSAKSKATIEKAPDPGSLPQAVSVVKDAQTEIPQRTVVQATVIQTTVAQENSVTSKIAEPEIAEAVLEETATPVQIAPSAFGKVRNCQSCGFPISEGRRLCLDCEAATPNLEPGNQDLQTVALLESSPSWLRSNLYLVGAAVLVVATIAIVVWRF